MEKKYTVFRYLAYSLEILIIYIVQGTPFFLPEILGGRPVLLIPVALTIAFYENEIPAMFFGLACGSLIDIGTGGMITKIKAAKAVTEKGIDMIIANGKNPDILYDIVEGKGTYTRFLGMK